MSSLIASGWSPRHAAAYVINDGDGEGAPLPVVTEEVRPDPVPPTPEEEAEHIEVVLQAAEALDAPRVSDELDFAFSIHSFDDLVDIWLGPILVATGQAWAEGRLSVAGEHFLSAGIERRLAKAFDEASHTRVTGPRGVIGTPRGSRHTIGAFAFATSLRRNGCAVTYLGADVPPDAWLHAATSRSADIVCVSVPTTDDAVAAGETVSLLAESHPELRIYVGGSGRSGVTATAAIHLDGTVSESAKRILADHAEATGTSPEVADAEAAPSAEALSAEARSSESARERATA